MLDDVQQGSDVAHERQELDNAAFAAKVTAVAALFAAAGLRPGGVLAIMLPNRVERSRACSPPGGSAPP